jgi:hypothetical protein
MTIRQFLHRFIGNGSDPYRAADDITGPAVSCRPGMHQLLEEPESASVAFTDEDREFLRQLGIRICCDGVEHVGNSRILTKHPVRQSHEHSGGRF